jgi:outer membrane protein TolC
MRPCPSLLALLLAASVAAPALASAQQPAAASDTLRLGMLQSAAVSRDPRGRQVELLASQSALRVRGLGSEWLPRLNIGAQAQYQSAVASVPAELTGGSSPAPPHKDTYDAYLGVRQPLYDPTLGARRAAEAAELARSQARVRTGLYTLRQLVADAYFGVLLLDAQSAEMQAGVTDLDAQLRVARERVAGGDALPSAAATLEAELLRRQQSLAELASERRATLAVLADLTGRPIDEHAVLAAPDLAADVAGARGAIESPGPRPEYAEFARTRDALDRQRGMIARRDWPRLSAIGRAGLGRPGLNPLSRDFTGYWLAGLQVEWSPWDWGQAGRERESLAIQREIVTTEETAFTEQLRRGAVRDLADIDRLAADLGTDDTIIALRARVLEETRLRFGEGVVTSAEYVDRETDLLSARLARAAHRVELAQARARFLTLVGLEVH